MNRRIGVMTWVAATILSVAASTAAVTSVRAHVTDRPDVVSLASLRRATSTTSSTSTTVTAPLAVSQSTTTTDPAPSSTATTRPAIVATPATTVETTSTTAPPRSEPTLDTGQETRSFRGGTVTVAFDGETLSLVEAIPDDGYQLTVEEQSDRLIALRFNREGRSSGFVAQVVNGRLQIRVID